MTITLETIGGERPWVARITGTDNKYGLLREFLAGVRDYSHANSKRTRGVQTTYTLAAGNIYQVSDPQTWNRTERYFLDATSNGIAPRITLNQVLALLASQTEVAA